MQNNHRLGAPPLATPFHSYLLGILFPALVIPTTSLTNWRGDAFTGVPQNVVTQTGSGILVQVRSSAGPLVYPLESAQRITGFRVRGEFSALPVLGDPSRQGERGSDDYPLRVGFVIPGEKQLTGVRWAFAAAWVKRLYALAPSGAGIDRIHFFNVTQNSSQTGHSREHPSSELIKESFFAAVTTPGKFDLEHRFEHPLDTVAIWISIDGDDTKSSYDVILSHLELYTE